ncbi:16S rRNA (uracil(1498)-N(3))-methyltransferase [Rhizosphaericola mali]|uniref:Ribosomal RNA small subunit methyltransferase E n=2 Tax=Rhizosphaericola mali TaxID=2545455 RepID=A0A5P2G8E3_9BACT|nr:16S rRNA (uracil(1498)-N(3))-methyltransferase [Rhizosphaericola mali]
MQLPFFYEPTCNTATEYFTLSEDTSKHCIQVLRMKKNEQILLTDGMGVKIVAAINLEHKKHTEVQIISKEIIPANDKKTCIAIGILKNNARFEWFLEKATELGISEIIPLITDNTEKAHFRLDRMKNILIAAMLQSQQYYLPIMEEPQIFKKFIQIPFLGQKLIAHCENGEKDYLPAVSIRENVRLLIGPEGDFSPNEIQLAEEIGYQSVSLGENRLRTETAGIVGVTFLQLNHS